MMKEDVSLILNLFVYGKEPSILYYRRRVSPAHY